tara:strand:- start:292 stop:468 length:177 start_codon:yes stop_codon:yes gene_type:complete
MNYTKLQEQAIEISELIEDVVESYCDENCVSGEQVWCMIYALSEIKLRDFPIDEEDEI